MSLDITLYVEDTRRETGIYIRKDGRIREITREEWDMSFPGIEPVMVLGESASVFSANITSNLHQMANEAGIGECLWNAEENGFDVAAKLIEPLEAGLTLLQSDPERFAFYNPSNGWGTYEVLVGFVEDVLRACKLYPTAKVRAWR